MKIIVLVILLHAALTPCALAQEETESLRVVRTGEEDVRSVQTDSQTPAVERKSHDSNVDRAPDSTSSAPALPVRMRELRVEKEFIPTSVLPGTEKSAVADYPEPATSIQALPTAPQKHSNLVQAWAELEDGNLISAQTLFSRLTESRVAETASQARLGLAYTLIRMGEDQRAAALLMQLAHEGYRLMETGPQAFDLLVQAGDLERAASLLALLPASEQSERRSLLKRTAARKALTGSAPQSQAERVALETLLSLDPADPSARERLGWHCLQTSDYACAGDIFAQLHDADPQNISFMEGLVLALRGAGRIEEALDLLDPNPPAELVSLQRSLLLHAAGQRYDQNDYETAVRQLVTAAQSAPLDREEQELLIWAMAKSGRESEALHLARKLYQTEKDLVSARTVLDLLDTRQENENALDFARVLGQSSEPTLRQLGAERLAASGLFRSAARVSATSNACFLNCDSPDLGTGLAYRFRDGDTGTSRLHRLDVPFEVRYPLASGWGLGAGVVQHTLDTGRGGDMPYMGSYYQAIATGSQLRHPEKSVEAWSPFLTLDSEGPRRFLLLAGTTPLDGPIDPMPTFLARYENPAAIHIQIHQAPVQDSLLSFVGQKDPYSPKDWGRMLRTGLELTRNLPLDAGFWLSLQAGVDYYWGHNTEENVSVSTTASFGQTRPLLGEWDANIGVFLNIQHFRRNSDFHTFGHGGYFSPEFFGIAGPFLRLTKAPCTPWFVDFETALGLKHSVTSAAPRYVGSSRPENALAEEEFAGEFDGDSKTGLAFSARLTTMRLITSNWAWGGFAGINTASDHQEAEGGLFVRFFFQPRNAVCNSEFPAEKTCR